MIATVPGNAEAEISDERTAVDSGIEENPDIIWDDDADGENDEGDKEPDAGDAKIAIQTDEVGELGAAKNQNAGGGGVVGGEDEVGGESKEEGELDEPIGAELEEDEDDAEKDAR